MSSDPLIKVVRTLLDDKARQEKSVKDFDLKQYFRTNNNSIVANVSTLAEVMLSETTNHRKSSTPPK